MSPNVGNFVHDLVEMAKAMETLPQVEAALRTAEQDNHRHAETIASREEAIIRYKAEIEALHAQLRATEAQRDDAETMFLELDQKVHRVLGDAEAIGVLVAGVKRELDPPKPVPMPEPEAKPEPIYTASGFEAQPAEVPKSDVDPTTHPDNASGMATATPSTTDASIAGAISTDVASMPEPAGPYSGKRYYDHPTYVPLQSWIAGGGTEADYNWRPNYSPSSRAD